MTSQLLPDAAQALGQADRLRRAGQPEEAERICRAILDARPQTVPAIHLLSIILVQRQKLDEAEQLARRAFGMIPTAAALASNLGNVLYVRGKWKEAVQAHATAVMLQPDYPEAHYNHANALREMQRHDEALAAYREAVRLRPGYTDAQAQIGATLIELGRSEDALAALDQAVVAGPEHFDALFHRGVALTMLDRYAEAVHALERAARLRPDNPQVHQALGNALGYVHREEEALAAYRRAIAAAPQTVSTHLDHNALAFTMGRKDQAFSTFAYARQKLGEVPDLMLAEAEQYLQIDEPAPAEPLLRRALDIAPDRADLLNARGRAATAQGRFAQAIPMFEAAAVRDPQNPLHWREMGVTQLHARDPEAAKSSLARALALAPSDQMVLGLFALALRESGDARYEKLSRLEGQLGVYDLPPPPGFANMAVFNHALAEELTRLHTSRSAPHNQTLRGGTQTAGNLFPSAPPLVALLRGQIDQAVADYIARMPAEPDHPLFGRRGSGFAYNGSWSCRLHAAGFHNNHLHPKGWISSAYYVALPDVVADEGQAQGWIKFGESNFSLGERDKPLGMVQPKVGRLVLFPSYFWHGTVPFQSAQPRLTVAFDVIPTP